MRYLTLLTDQGPAAHVRHDGSAYLVRRRDGGTYDDLAAVLAAGQAGDEDARAAHDRGDAVTVELSRVLRPVLSPGAVVCVGLNFRSHILEMGRDLPSVPTLFSKLPRALTDPYAPIELPNYSEQVDYEAELAVIIGSGGRDIPESQAWSAVGGLTVVNDVTVRDWQWRTKQWFAGKTGEAMTPLGPEVVTPDELLDGFAARRLRLSVNGEVRQDAPLGDLLFDVPALIADLSRIITLRAGDVIATGTPGGVAGGMDEPRWLRDGDEAEASIDGIGALRNVFRAARRPAMAEA